MHPSCLLLGQVHPRRPLHQPNVKLQNRFFYHRGFDLYIIFSTRTDDIFSAHVFREEIGTCGHSINGVFVSGYDTLAWRTLMRDFCSVCITSIFRIIYLSQIDNRDISCK